MGRFIDNIYSVTEGVVKGSIIIIAFCLANYLIDPKKSKIVVIDYECAEKE